MLQPSLNVTVVTSEVIIQNCAEHHIETTHRELQCQDCNFKVISINSMKTHIQSGHKFIQTIASAN